MKPWLTLLAGALLMAAAPAQELPVPVRQALLASRLPADSLAVWIGPLEVGSPQRLSWREHEPHNPASLAKLATTWAALEQLGPAWHWRTPVWIQGKLDPQNGELHGDVVLAGRGDPSLVLEHIWLLLRRLQQQGVRSVQGDFVLDNRAFEPDLATAADFDGEPWRPGNVRPDALLFNFKSWTLHIQPDPARQVAWLSTDLPMPLSQDRVPLRAGACSDPRGTLRLNWRTQPPRPAEATPMRLDGHWPSACGEHRWPLADPDPNTYNHRLLAALWRELGGRLKGRVRDGWAPVAQAPTFEWSSPSLAEVVRDVNKHSNNLMAEQLALTLALQSGLEPVGVEAARSSLQRWLQRRLGWKDGDFVWDRASGLSRHTRLSARQLAELLQVAWTSPVMPEFVASLPRAGEDGTLARDPARFGAVIGRAHLKTGSLRDVQAMAGYVQGRSGRRYVLVALLQHPQAGQGQPVLEALLRWTYED